MGHRPVVFASLATASALILGGCSSRADSGANPTSIPNAYTKLPTTAAVGDCGPDSGATVAEGVLTIATDSPAYAPWIVDNDPSNGKGFEGAVARSVAETLGYRADQVVFVRVPFNDAIKPGEKNYDFDINQVTIVGDRREAVDFSSPYYAVAQSVVAMEGTPAAAIDSLDALAPFRLGAQSGSTSLASITGTIRPSREPVEFATNDEAKAALVAGTIDALVVDIPTGFQITATDLPNSKLIGQFPRPNTVTEFFGLVLEKNSPMTACTSAAVDALYADGTLDQLAQTWLADTAGVPILN
ncbi:transporter substrate-binding domain-containing protein [Rhodococcus sp. NPDC058514]|uniref:ABC transporter substrate-binding protein n=1 Tax=unclassified Rhodococcus (in: high G+C Gram-positive bacteria) TaxID=192944 RepID=UPI00364E0996